MFLVCVTKVESVKQKMKETFIRNYGEDHPMKVREILSKTNKSRYTYKSIVFQNRTFKYQGYEDSALYILIQEEHISVDDIFTDIVPKFKYRLNDKEHVYHPDIFVKPNRIIETKCDFTLFGIDNDKCLINAAKFRSVIDSGYIFELWVFDKKKDYKKRVRLCALEQEFMNKWVFK